MAEIDQIAAARAMLEMLTIDNQSMQEHFKEVFEKLDAIEQLPPGIKAVQFRQLEHSGAFKYKEMDIRYFAKPKGKHGLSPPQFVQRTTRRLKNTSSLIDAFVKKQGFDIGPSLMGEIDLLINDSIDEQDQNSVIEFKNRVESFRATDLFSQYMNAKKSFIMQDEELKTDAEIMAAKETVADGEMMCNDREARLEDIKQKMDSGELSPEKAQEMMEGIEAETDPSVASAEEDAKPVESAEEDESGLEESDPEVAEAKTEA